MNKKDSLKKSGAQHYIKWKITDDLSLRFYFLFQDRKNYENKYFLKSHNSKDYIEIVSENILQELKSISIEMQEIVGRTINGNYTKLINPFDIYNGMDSCKQFFIEYEEKGENMS